MLVTDAIKQLLAPDMKRVDDVIRENLHSDVLLIRQVSEYIIGAGGKRMRPALVLLAAGALNYRGATQHTIAAIVEFIHTATLLHDDVVDESDLRRGQETANALFGNAASVLVGDFLYSRAFQMMVGVNDMRVMQVLANTTNAIAEGEVLQLLNAHDPDIDEGRYFNVIRCKTAELFQAAARLGAQLAKASPEQEKALADYGLHLGLAFQLVDDILDYSGNSEETGKNVGDDLAEGKVTLPLLQAMRVTSGADRALLQDAIRQGGRDKLAEIIRIVKESRALAYAAARAESEAALAKSALSVLPNSNYTDCLVKLSDFAVARDH